MNKLSSTKFDYQVQSYWYVYNPLSHMMRTPCGLHEDSMDSMRTPWGLHEDSTGTPRGLHKTLKGLSWLLSRLCKVHEESMRSPWGVHEDLWSPWGVHGNVWGTVKYSGKAVASFLTSEPFRHLLDIILLVWSMVGRFCEVNVKVFGALTAVAICRSPRDDHSNVVLHGVEFGYIEIVSTFSHGLLNKVVEILMEGDPHFLEFPKRICSVRFKMCIINKIKCCSNNMDEPRFSCPWKYT